MGRCSKDSTHAIIALAVITLLAVIQAISSPELPLTICKMLKEKVACLLVNAITHIPTQRERPEGTAQAIVVILRIIQRAMRIGHDNSLNVLCEATTALPGNILSAYPMATIIGVVSILNKSP